MKALQLKLTRVDQQYVQVDTCNQGSCVKCHTALANSGFARIFVTPFKLIPHSTTCFIVLSRTSTSCRWGMDHSVSYVGFIDTYVSLCYCILRVGWAWVFTIPKLWLLAVSEHHNLKKMCKRHKTSL